MELRDADSQVIIRHGAVANSLLQNNWRCFGMFFEHLMVLCGMAWAFLFKDAHKHTGELESHPKFRSFLLYEADCNVVGLKPFYQFESDALNFRFILFTNLSLKFVGEELWCIGEY